MINNAHPWIKNKRINYEIKNHLSELIIDIGYRINNTHISFFISPDAPEFKVDQKFDIFIKLYLPKYNVTSTIVLNNHYPFHQPNKIQVNNHNYISLLCINQGLLKLVSDKKCLCCSSLTCPNNWSPILKIKDILKEIDETLYFKKKISWIICCNVIKRKYLVEDINIEQYF